MAASPASVARVLMFRFDKVFKAVRLLREGGVRKLKSGAVDVADHSSI
jgi:hypothetical protein